MTQVRIRTRSAPVVAPRVRTRSAPVEVRRYTADEINDMLAPYCNTHARPRAEDWANHIAEIVQGFERGGQEGANEVYRRVINEIPFRYGDAMAADAKLILQIIGRLPKPQGLPMGYDYKLGVPVK